MKSILILALSTVPLLACSSDPEPGGGAAGSSGTSSSAGSGQGGTSSSAGSSSSGSSGAGSPSGGGGAAAGNGGGGAGGSSAGAGGSGGAGGSTGAGGTGGGGGGGAGGGSAMPTAVANIMGVSGQTVTGTATFTQGATMTTLVLDLTACPNGVHASHLHQNKDCGNNGEAAGGHWANGETLGDYTCANNKGTLTVMRGIDKWTVGDGSATDVSKHAFMVHENGDDDPGGRIGCGLIEKK